MVVTISDDEREERITEADKQMINQQMEKAAQPIKYLPDWKEDPALKDSHTDVSPLNNCNEALTNEKHSSFLSHCLLLSQSSLMTLLKLT